MNIFNVPQFYNGVCCYFKSTCFSFDKVIKLFTFLAYTFLHKETHAIWDQPIKGV